MAAEEQLMVAVLRLILTGEQTWLLTSYRLQEYPYLFTLKAYKWNKA